MLFQNTRNITGSPLHTNYASTHIVFTTVNDFIINANNYVKEV